MVKLLIGALIFLIELFKRNGASMNLGAPFHLEYSASVDLDAQGIVGYRMSVDADAQLSA